VLKRDFWHFTKAHPQPRDLELVVKVADTKLHFTLTTKVPLYARAGIADYWVLDIAGRRMIVHREPCEGRDSSIVVYGIDESVALTAPESLLKIGEAFPE
jgi:hypothetical protein